MSYTGYGQRVDTLFKGENSLDGVVITNQVGNIKVFVQSHDSLDVKRLDSIIASIDTSLNNLEPASNIYGHGILKNDSIQVFQPLTISRVPDSYVVSVGDEISVSIFGTSQYEGRFIVDTSGFVKPQNLPKIFLKGMSWARAQGKIRRSFSNYFIFRNEQFAAVLSNPRQITINIFGEVENPGTYRFPATNSAFTALIGAGGVTKIGSVRKIGLYDGRSSKTMDLYELLAKPGLQFQNYLEDNMLIQVPPSEKVVSIKGAVKRPMKYELIESEGLLDLIQFAGGLNADAISGLVQIDRYTGDERVLIDIDLDEIFETREKVELRNGDVINIRASADVLKNVVEVEGAVELEGNFSLENTRRIDELISKARLKDNARLDIGFLVRLNRDSTYKLIQLNLEEIITNPSSTQNLELEAFDKLVVTSLSTYVERSTISVSGAVRERIKYPFDPDETITLNQAILLAGGLSNEAAEEGFIIRRSLNDPNETQYIKVNFIEAISNPGGSGNLILRPHDKIIVLFTSQFTDVSTVTMRGAVRNKQALKYDESLSLQHLIFLSGGLSSVASGKIKVYRLNSTPEGTAIAEINLKVNENYEIIEGPENFSLQPNDQVVASEIQDFELQSIVRISGEARIPGEYALIVENEKITNLIARAGGLSDEAFSAGVTINRPLSFTLDSLGQRNYSNEYNLLSVRLDLALSNPSSPSNFILKDGDQILIPKKDNLVYINLSNTKAEVKDEESISPSIIGVSYNSGKNAKWYLDHFAGGLKDKADINNILVKSPNGTVAGTKGRGIFRKIPKVQEGAIISVISGDEVNLEDALSQQSINSGNPKLNKGIIVNFGEEPRNIDNGSNQ